MPNIITHTLFSDDVLQLLPEKEQETIDMHRGLFQIGANGPDYLFFSNMNGRDFWKKDALRSAGGKLHKGNVNAFYKAALEAVHATKNASLKADMVVYVCGHLCHWALDSTAHPYIFYKTGTGTSQSSWRHHAMESLLDAIMLKVKKGVTIEEYRFPDIACCSLNDARAVARVYVPAVEAALGEKISPHKIKEALEDWHRMQTVFYDAGNHKKKGLQVLEKIIGIENSASGLIVPVQAEDNWDVCNLKHLPWCHPCDASQVSTESFFDLYQTAVQKAVQAIELFFKAVKDEDQVSDFLAFLDDRSYDTGLNTGVPMQYSDPIHFEF